MNSTEPQSSCGPDCSCNTKQGLSPRIKIILFVAIIVAAGTVLGISLMKKSQAAQLKTIPAYAVSHSPAFQTTSSNDTANGNTDANTIVFKPLATLSDLNTVAMNVDGVFILLLKSDSEKTTSMVKEIADATKTIEAHSVRMGLFQLASTSPDFSAMSAQLKMPSVIVVIKGKGMRGVQGSEIVQTKLLQAYMAAMQPTSCCPSGGNRVCK